MKFWLKNGSVLLLSAAVLPLTAAECSLSGDSVLLSNERLLAEISLSRGGRVVRLYDKRSAAELTGMTGTPGGSGLFSEGLYEPGNVHVNKIFQKQCYLLKFHRSGTIASAGIQSPAGLPLCINKTYSLKDGEDRLRVSYEITNPGKTDFVGALYFNNGFFFPGESRYVMEFPEGHYSKNWAAGPARVRNRLLFEPGKNKTADHFIHRPVRDYVAVCGKKAGVVLEVPFPFLDFFYSHAGGAGSCAVVDWFTMPFQLPPLEKGKKEAVLLAVMQDPLAAYKLRFTTSVRVVDAGDFSYGKYRAPSTEAKSEAFVPRISGSRMMTEFRTPAVIREYKPLRKIKLAAVAIAHGNSEMGELNRRLKTDMFLVDTSNATAFNATPFFGWKIPLPEMELMPVLKKNPDIILMTGHHEKKIPVKIKQKLKQLVENGAAFIYISKKNAFPFLVPSKGGTDLPPEVFRGICKDSLPGFGPVKVFNRGKGKVIHVQFSMAPYNMDWLRESRCVIPYTEIQKERLFYWEHYFAFYGKLFRYAAGIDSPASIEAVEKINNNMKLKLRADRPVKNAVLSLVLDTPSGRKLKKDVWRGDLAAGSKSATVALPSEEVFQAGDYTAFLSLAAPEGTLDWFDIRFTQRNPAEIRSLKSDLRVFAKDAAVTGEAVISGKGDLTLKLREAATDRIAARHVFKNASGRIRFKLKRDFHSYQKLYKIEAELRRSGKLASSAVQNVLLRPDMTDPVRIRPLIWGAHLMSWRDRLMNQEISDAGFRVFKSPVARVKSAKEFARECDDVLQYGMDYAPLGIEHILAAKPSKAPYMVRKRCLRDPAYQKYLRQNSENVGNKMKQSLSDYCFIGDEISFGHYFDSAHDYCYSPWCLAAFRQAMKEKYRGDLKKLNRNWQTAFSSWQEVRPRTRQESRQKGNCVSTLEHRTFMMGNLASACQIIADSIKSISGAETGVSGMGPSTVYQGFDQSRAMAFLKCSTVYHTQFLIDQLRSSMTQDHMTGSYTDYGPRYMVWEQLIGGFKMPSVWWYGHLIRRGDGRLSEEGLLLKQMFALLRNSGAEHILGYGTRKNSPVTLIWSTASLVAAEVGRQPESISGRDYMALLDSWSQLIRDLGIDSPNVLPDHQLDKISPETHPVVVLPCTLSLSGKNIGLLKKYVRSGGMLIADLYPGVYDEFCVRRTANPLNDLFGIADPGEHIPADPALTVGSINFLSVLFGSRLTAAGNVQSLLSVNRRVKGIKAGSIRLNASREFVAPAFLVKGHGKGKAVYLNFFFARYNKLYKNPDVPGSLIRQTMRHVFQTAGIDTARLHTLPGGSSYAEYALGGCRYWFLSRQASPESGKYELKNEEKAHCYNMLTGTYLGNSALLKNTLPGNGFCFIGAFPEKLGAFSGSIRFDGRRIRIAAERRHPGFQEPLRLKIYHNNREIRTFSQTFMLQDRLNQTVDLGLEPAPGLWKVVLTAIADNKKTEHSFTVSK